MKIDTNKILLAGGCSLTEPNRDKYLDKPVPIVPLWCDNLSKQYDMTLVNLAIGGMSNPFISQRINEYIIKNHKKIGLVCILWTDFERISFYNHIGFDIIPRTSTHPISPGKADDTYAKLFIQLLCKDRYHKGTILESIVKYNIMAFNSVETLCKLHNIPYILCKA